MGRDPLAVIQSAITVMAYSDRLRRHAIDTGWLVDYWAYRVKRLLRACVWDREVAGGGEGCEVTSTSFRAEVSAPPFAVT